MDGARLALEKVHKDIAKALMAEGLDVNSRFLPEDTKKPGIEDLGAGRVRVPDREVDDPVQLTTYQYRLFQALHDRTGEVCTPDMIAREVWGEKYEGDVDSQRVSKLVSRLRKRIEPDPSHPRYILTEWGYGYRLIKTPSSPS